LDRYFAFSSSFHDAAFGLIPLNLVLKNLFIRLFCGIMRGFYGLMRFDNDETGNIPVLFL
jgi:hypothetical protein